MAVGFQLLTLYTSMHVVFGIVPLAWLTWVVMLPVVAVSSLASAYMTCWILRLVPLWQE